MSPRLRLALILGLALAAIAPSSAEAQLLGTAPASYCDTNASQPFAPWSDYAQYVLTPGGSFESGSVSWSLKGGAAVVPGNESFYVRSPRDKRSLSLPGGSSAVTPTMCFALGDWHLRFFARNTGSTGSLEVDVLVRSLTGVLTVLDGGTISASGEWRPSPRIGLLVCNVTSLVGTRAVAFRFRSLGSGARFQIDDVYLDPWKSR
jgi:hypothetical protein